MPKKNAAVRPASVDPPSLTFVATSHPPFYKPITLTASRENFEKLTSDIKQKAALVQWLAFAQAHNDFAMQHEACEKDAWWCIEDLLRDIRAGIIKIRKSAGLEDHFNEL
jgi:hypothetical protein